MTRTTGEGPSTFRSTERNAFSRSKTRDRSSFERNEISKGRMRQESETTSKPSSRLAKNSLSRQLERNEFEWNGRVIRISSENNRSNHRDILPYALSMFYGHAALTDHQYYENFIRSIVEDVILGR